MRICIDPGHYGSDYNPGVAAGYVESNFTWAYAWLLKERLEKYNVEVVLTRTNKADDLPLQTRGKLAAGSDLFISVHSNAVDNKPDMDAVFCHWSVRSGGEGIAKLIGNALTDFFKSEWGSINEPCLYSVESTKHPGYDYYGVLKGAASVEVPAVIVEHSFHTNRRYCEWAMTAGNIERMADVEVQAIVDYYGLNKPIEDDIYWIPLNTNLKKGDKGEAVKRLQMRMRQVSQEFDEEVKAHSFKNGVPDGSFGGKMVDTIKKFQRYAGLETTGELDAETREVLNSNLATVYCNLGDADNVISQVREIVC